MTIPLEWLEQITTISTLRVLVAFFKKAKSEGKGSFEYALKEIYTDSGVASNSARRALDELIEKGFIGKEVGSGQTPNTYTINLAGAKVDGPRVDTSTVEPTTAPEGWQKSSAARKKRVKPQEAESTNSIKYLDLFSFNLYTENINSMSEENLNKSLTDKEIGQLARRLVMEIFLPRLNTTVTNQWFGYQTGLMKTLLQNYRTEQVIAALVYWTEISDQKITSLRYLTYANKRGSKLMTALDYFKAECLKRGGDSKMEEVIDRVAGQEEIERQKIEQERERVASMSDDDFLDSLLGSIGGL